MFKLQRTVSLRTSLKIADWFTIESRRIITFQKFDISLSLIIIVR
jgi:hypothetical protein